MSAYEVLEIGDDGVFDIPSPPKPTKVAAASSEDGEAFIKASKFQGKKEGYVFKTSTSGTGYYYDSIQGAPMQKMEEKVNYVALKESIQPGEYKLYKEAASMLVLLRTSSADDKVKDIKFKDSKVVINIESADSYSVDIPDTYDVSSSASSAKIWNDFVSIRIPVM